MLKKTITIIAALTMLLLTGCANTNTSEKQQKLKVMTTFDAMREFITAVGGDKVEVTKMIPDGTEPHDFEPKAKDLAALSDAKLFVYNGLGMESWAQSAIAAAGNNMLIAVEASKGVETIASGEKSDHGSFDPHTWLSLKCAQTEVINIKDALVKADPQNSAYYEKNCADYTQQLQKLYEEYSEKLGSVKTKHFVTGHAAFAYLCRDFGISQNSVEDVFAEGEPTAGRLTELIAYCRQNNVKTVFVEELVSPDISQTLASEVGADIKTVYTIESSEDGKIYIDRMRDNLQAIYESMK